MKKLLENFKRYIAEAAVTDVTDIAMAETEEIESQTVILYSMSRLKAALERGHDHEDSAEEAIIGYMEFGKIMRKGDDPDWDDAPDPAEFVCYAPPPKEAWQVEYSVARKGFGPLLYDSALSIVCTETEAVGMMADRGVVSSNAQRIWTQWLKRGSGATGISVRARQLDRTPPNNKTPPREDDCYTHVKLGYEHPINHIFDTSEKPAYIDIMRGNHIDLMKELNLQNNREKGMRNALYFAGSDLFNRLMQKYSDKEGERLEEDLEETGVFFAKNKKFSQPYIEPGMQMNEEEPYQADMRRKHPARKARLITKGGNKTKVYPGVPSTKRSPSSPPGPGGSR